MLSIHTEKTKITQAAPPSHPTALNIYLSLANLTAWQGEHGSTAPMNIKCQCLYALYWRNPSFWECFRQKKKHSNCQLYVHIFVRISKRTKHFCDLLEEVMGKWVTSGLGDTLFKDSPSMRDDSFLNQSAKSYTQKLTLDLNFHLERLYK